MNILDLVLYHMLFLQFALVNPPPQVPNSRKLPHIILLWFLVIFFISSQWGFLLHKCCHLTRIFSSSCESPHSIALFFVFFLDIAFNFEINVWLIVFLTWSSSYSFTYSPIIISPLPLTFGDICVQSLLIMHHVTTTPYFSKSYMPMRVYAIRIVVNSTSSKENFGSIVEFRNHCHLTISLPWQRNDYRLKWNKNKMNYTHTNYSKLQKLGVVSSWEGQPYIIFLKLICPR